MKNAPAIHAAIIASKDLESLAEIENHLLALKDKLTDKSYQYLVRMITKKLEML